MPIPILLLIAFAIFLWLTFLRPVSLPCLIRPMGVMYSDIMEKFCSSRMPALAHHIFVVSASHKRTLYSTRGSNANMSNTSLSGCFRAFHFLISAGDRSCGAYTSPARQRLAICRVKAFLSSFSCTSGGLLGLRFCERLCSPRIISPNTLFGVDLLLPAAATGHRFARVGRSGG